MNNLTKASLFHYTPRNTDYRVLHHNVQIKAEDGSWKLGCVYQGIDEGNVYSRPYEMFDMNKWKIISQ